VPGRGVISYSIVRSHAKEMQDDGGGWKKRAMNETS